MSLYKIRGIWTEMWLNGYLKSIISYCIYHKGYEKALWLHNLEKIH